jgi:3-hexulose-6-phosphate synthase
MKIQLAIDRVTLDCALEIISKAVPAVDIIEVGTSLIKDYGIESVFRTKTAFPDTAVLADMKTIDEGEYEFRAAYRHGADIATVMGAASLTTVRACKNVANELGRDYMIDLLEVSPEKIKALMQFEDAIFCVHLPADKNGEGLNDLIRKSRFALHGVKRLAVAGGVSLSSIKPIKRAGFEIAIVGGNITKSADIAAQTLKFCDMAKS